MIDLGRSSSAVEWSSSASGSRQKAFSQLDKAIWNLYATLSRRKASLTCCQTNVKPCNKLGTFDLICVREPLSETSAQTTNLLTVPAGGDEIKLLAQGKGFVLP